MIYMLLACLFLILFILMRTMNFMFWNFGITLIDGMSDMACKIISFVLLALFIGLVIGFNCMMCNLSLVMK